MIRFSRDAVTLWGLEIHWYGVLIAAGALLAILIAARREERLGVPKDSALNLALLCIPVGIICSRLYYVAFSWDYYGAHPAEIFDIRGGGLAIYGGVIGGALAGFIYARAKKISFLRLADLVAPGIALAQAVGRWGNFLNREAYGAECAIPALRFFPVCVQIDGVYHYATFFYESLWCALLCAFLLLWEGRRRLRRPGDTALAYVFFYGAERAMVEWLRADSLYIGSFRVSQLLSLGALGACCVYLCFRHRRLSPLRRPLPALLWVLTVLFVALNLCLPALGCALGCALIGGINMISEGKREEEPV